MREIRIVLRLATEAVRVVVGVLFLVSYSCVSYCDSVRLRYLPSREKRILGNFVRKAQRGG